MRPKTYTREETVAFFQRHVSEDGSKVDHETMELAHQWLTNNFMPAAMAERDAYELKHDFARDMDYLVSKMHTDFYMTEAQFALVMAQCGFPEKKGLYCPRGTFLIKTKDTRGRRPWKPTF